MADAAFPAIFSSHFINDLRLGHGRYCTVPQRESNPSRDVIARPSESAQIFRIQEGAIVAIDFLCVL